MPIHYKACEPHNRPSRHCYWACFAPFLFSGHRQRGVKVQLVTSYTLTPHILPLPPPTLIFYLLSLPPFFSLPLFPFLPPFSLLTSFSLSLFPFSPLPFPPLSLSAQWSTSSFRHPRPLQREGSLLHPGALASLAPKPLYPITPFRVRLLVRPLNPSTPYNPTTSPAQRTSLTYVLDFFDLFSGLLRPMIWTSLTYALPSLIDRLTIEDHVDDNNNETISTPQKKRSYEVMINSEENFDDYADQDDRLKFDVTVTSICIYVLYDMYKRICYLSPPNTMWQVERDKLGETGVK